MKELDLLEQYLSASPEQRRTIASPGGISFLNAGIVSPQNQAAAVMPSAEGQRMPIMKDAAKGVPSYLMKNEDYAKQAKIPNSISRTYTPTAEDNLNAALISGLPGEAKFKAERQDVGPVEIARPEPEFSRPIDKKNFISKKPMPKAAQSIAAASIPVAPPAPEPVAEVIQPPTPEPVFELPPATEPQTSIVDKYNEGMGKAELKSDIDRMTNDAMIDKLSQPSKLRNSLNDKVLEFALNGKKFEPSRNYNADIDRLNKESQDLKGTSDGDMLSHLIYSLGAPLLGALSGSSGALAAPKAQADIDKESQLHWKARAQMRAKLEDSISKRMNAIKGLRSEEFDNNFKEQEMFLKKYQLLNEVVKGADLTQKDQFDKYMTLKNNLDMEAAKAGFSAPKTAAEIEQRSIDEQGRNQRDADKRDAEAWRAQQKAIEDAKKLKAQQDFTTAENEKRMKFQAEQNKNRDAALKSRAGIIANTRTTPDERQRARDETTHRANIQAFKKDKMLNNLTVNATNLDKAKFLLHDMSVTDSKEKLEDVQQNIIAAMGLKGAGDKEARHARNAVKGLGVDYAEMMSYLTNKPTDVNAPGIKKYLESLINNEQFSNKFLVDPFIEQKLSGYKSMYERRPELKADLMDIIDQTKKTFDMDIQKGKTSPGGSVNKQKMIDKLMGK